MYRLDKKRVKIAAISLPHYGPEIPDYLRAKSQEYLLEEARVLIQTAGQQHVDFIVLPEMFGFAGIPESIVPMRSLAEVIPGKGKVFTFLQNQAIRYHTHIVTSVLEKKDARFFNCGILINRKGQLIGKYHKVHPAPREDITPGIDFPVFFTEGICCGILICFDMNFPESARCLALQGADIIFWPTMWGIPREDAYYDAVLRARAGENLCYIVSAALVRGPNVYTPESEIRGRTCIVSWNSEILSEVKYSGGIAIAEINLVEKRYLQAERKELLGKYRHPDCYKIITSKKKDIKG